MEDKRWISAGTAAAITACSIPSCCCSLLNIVAHLPIVSPLVCTSAVHVHAVVPLIVVIATAEEEAQRIVTTDGRRGGSARQ